MALVQVHHHPRVCRGTCAAAAIPETLRELGADPVKVLRGAGLEPDVFSNPDNVLTFAALGRLVSECVRATGREDFGLRVGAKTGRPGSASPALCRCIRQRFATR
jgi:hypothetical protein